LNGDDVILHERKYVSVAKLQCATAKQLPTAKELQEVASSSVPYIETV
jgi:hypothetical protein